MYNNCCVFFQLCKINETETLLARQPAGIWNFLLTRPSAYPFTIPRAFPWCRHSLEMATQFPGIATWRLSTWAGVGLFRSTTHKWSLVPLANCRCRAEKQTTDHILASCPLYHLISGTLGLAALDDDTVDWLQATELCIL